MCVCVCVYIYTYIYIYTPSDLLLPPSGISQARAVYGTGDSPIYVCIYICIYICVCVYVCVYIHIYIYIYIRPLIPPLSGISQARAVYGTGGSPIYVCIYICIYICVCVCVCIYMYIYIRPLISPPLRYLSGTRCLRHWRLSVSARGANDGPRKESLAHRTSGKLAFTKYSFTSSRLCTNQSSFHSSRPPALPTLLQ